MTKKVCSLIPAVALMALLPTRGWAGSAPVTVINTATNPAIIRDNDNAGRHPFTAFCTFSGTQPQCQISVPPQAQLGAETVIEMVSISASSTSGGSVLAPVIQTIVSANQVPFFLNPLQNILLGGTSSEFSGSQLVRLYADPGYPNAITCGGSIPGGPETQQFTFFCTISGYTVALP